MPDKLINNEKLMKEWDWEKNQQLGIYPDNFNCGSGKKVWWKIHYIDVKTKKEYDLSWEASIAHRNNNRGCPYISEPIKKILVGFNDLKTTHPKLAEIWATKENDELGIKITEVSYGSTKDVFWNCNIHGIYKTKISDKVKGNGCPYCSGKQIKIGFNDLKTTHPKLALEWDYEKNKISPEMVSKGCTKSYWWKCSKGHSWKATPNCRTKCNCPYCAGKKVLIGFNDLNTLFPNISKEWNYEKNKFTPEQVVSKSNKKVWWVCKFGHEYQAQIYQRTKYNVGCSICNKERKTSFPEKVIFYYIKKYFNDALENANFKWLGKSELDIFIPSLNVGIEYDGNYWHKNINTDLIKDNLCNENNITLIRIRVKGCPLYNSNSIKFYYENDFNFNNLSYVITNVFEYLKNKYNLYFNYDININRDYFYIMEKYITKEKENNLAINRPDLIQEWDYNKNGKIRPEFVSLFSNKYFWWICPKCNQSYKMKVIDRTGQKHSNCPICASKRIIKGINDFGTNNPDILKEWDFEKNIISPYEISSGNHNKVWWKCSKGHSWQTNIYVRTIMKCGCPVCTHQVADINNNFAITFPNLLEEWDYKKNKRDPYTLLPNSNLKFWWKCKKCNYEWQSTISHRTQGRNCPLCANRVLIRGVNDLETQFPIIAKEWNYEKNTLKPYEVSGGTNKKYWWKCKKCNYEWECVVASRTKRASKCPICRKIKK